MKLKYKVNYNPAIYNFTTKKYERKEATYLTYEQARANQWNVKNVKDCLQALEN